VFDLERLSVNGALLLCGSFSSRSFWGSGDHHVAIHLSQYEGSFSYDSVNSSPY
jgi:hypothetical protein